MPINSTAVAAPAAGPVTRRVGCAHPGGLHRMAYHDHAPRPDRRNGRTVLCVHGLTRNGRDFDPLAARLVDRGYRVVCPDLPGRGESDWLTDASHYQIPQYVADCITLLARLDTERVDWIGTSLGGLVAMTLAGMPGHPIDRLVINDIGPQIEQAGFDRIRGYVGDTRVHASFADAEAALRVTMRHFGPHDDADFRALSRHAFRPRLGGGLVAHYDPGIATAVRAGGSDAMPSLWSCWERMRLPVLALRGAESDILSRATLERMSRTGPRCSSREFAGVGHAPTLIDSRQCEVIIDWLGAL